MAKAPPLLPKPLDPPFDLHLAKYLRGAKVLAIEALTRERIVVIWFSGGEMHSAQPDAENLGLVITLIPAAPEAFLVGPVSQRETNDRVRNQSSWPILARSRPGKECKDPKPNDPKDANVAGTFSIPDNSAAPLDLPIREELLANLTAYYHVVEKSLRAEAFDLRLQRVQRILSKSLKQAAESFKQSQMAAQETTRDQDWQRWGDLLKATLGQVSEFPLEHAATNHDQSTQLPDRRSVDGKTLFLTDPANGEKVAIPIDPQLNLVEQTQKFYQKAKKKLRRAQESQSRMEQFRETCDSLKSLLDIQDQIKDWPALENWERRAGLRSQSEAGLATLNRGGAGKKANLKPWPGKTFLSAEGYLIWVGRSKDENLQLTFKQARGNDIWMHLRGRPGAHVVIPLSAGKSAPLEALLDAAHLTIHYSGGSNWGKTEVDYTFKKYVKRIKDSTEASYTHNKTLFIQVDPSRMKRLLDQGFAAPNKSDGGPK